MQGYRFSFDQKRKSSPLSLLTWSAGGVLAHAPSVGSPKVRPQKLMGPTPEQMHPDILNNQELSESS